MWHTIDFTPTAVSRKSRTFILNQVVIVVECLCWIPLVSKNGYSTAEDAVQQLVNTDSRTSVQHALYTLQCTTTQLSLHLHVVQRLLGEGVHLH
jgi:hypothetical protein